MKEKAKKKVLMTVDKMIRRKLEYDEGRPPICLAIYHQPKRPRKKQ